MDSFWNVLQSAGAGLGMTVVVLLCIVAIILSCLSISGTWVVGAAAVMAMLLRPAGFPGIWTPVCFFLLAGIVEVIEFFSGTWGVRRQGGSRLAGFMALVGGVIGIFAGLIIPIPLIGSLLGMLICSFLLVYLVEWKRLQRSDHAIKIAMGSVIARILIILVKVSVTLGMTVWLLFGILLD